MVMYAFVLLCWNGMNGMLNAEYSRTVDGGGLSKQQRWYLLMFAFALRIPRERCRVELFGSAFSVATRALDVEASTGLMMKEWGRVSRSVEKCREVSRMKVMR
jgi:hypothetical protein